MGFKRKHSRVEIGKVGRLQRGDFSAACKVLDISESGVRLESRLFVKSGERLQLIIELGQEQTVSCELEIVHARLPKLGAKIISMSSDDHARLAQLVDDQIQIHFSRG